MKKTTCFKIEQPTSWRALLAQKSSTYNMTKISRRKCTACRSATPRHFLIPRLQVHTLQDLFLKLIGGNSTQGWGTLTVRAKHLGLDSWQWGDILRNNNVMWLCSMRFKGLKWEMNSKKWLSNENQIKIHRHTLSPVPGHRFDDLIHLHWTTIMQQMKKLSWSFESQ